MDENKVISREDYSCMLALCKEYKIPMFGSNYSEDEVLLNKNRSLERLFNNIVSKYINNYASGIHWIVADRIDPEVALRRNLIDRHHLEVAKKVWTEEEILRLISTNDTVLCNGLMKLYALQTEEERNNGTTNESNGIGFNSFDADFLSSVAKFYQDNGFITDNQKEVVRKKLAKYVKQLVKIANE